MAASKEPEAERLLTGGVAIAGAVILVVFVLVLHLMGRIPICECGFGIWTGSPRSSSTSQHLFDPYSFTHILHGILFYAALVPFKNKLTLRERLIAAILMEVAWETLENTPMIISRYRVRTAAPEYFGDSILNSVGDLMAAIAGFWIACRLPWKITAIIVVLVELVLIVTIRDSLFLSVLMLIWPSSTIQAWQMGG